MRLTVRIKEEEPFILEEQEDWELFGTSAPKASLK